MKILLSVITFLLSTQFLVAQTADEIIQKYIAARGGKEKLDAIKTIYMEGSEEIYGRSQQFEIVIENKKFYRKDVIYPNRKIFDILIDSPALSAFTNLKNGVTKLADSVAKSRKYKLDIEGSLINYALKGHKVDFIKKDTINGATECYKLKFTSNIGTEIYYWFDAKTFLKVQSSIIDTAPIYTLSNKRIDLPVEDIISYNNYRMVDGVLFPFSQTISVYSHELKKELGTINTFYVIITPNIVINPNLYRFK